jgi:hypothetical protein
VIFKGIHNQIPQLVSSGQWVCIFYYTWLEQINYKNGALSEGGFDKYEGANSYILLFYTIIFSVLRKVNDF